MYSNKSRHIISTILLIELITVTTALLNTAAAQTPPTADDLNITTTKNTPVTNTLPATDPDDDPLVYEIVYQPQKGTVTIPDPNSGTFTYTPNTDETGTDTFQFKASDGTSDSNVATVTVTIEEAAATPTPEPPAFVYADLVNHWANYSAGKLADRGIIIGEKIAGKYYFYPDKIMNRAEFNLFLNAALQINSDAIGSEPVGFADENEIPIWVIHEARAAKRQNLINGSLQDGKVYYNAFDKLTRLETMVILHNALKPDANNTDPLTFADAATLPDWSIQYVKNMKGYGIMRGYEDNTIRPYQTISRAEAAEILYQLIKYLDAHPEQ